MKVRGLKWMSQLTYKDRDSLVTFVDFPAKNWCNIRTTIPFESTFATIRLRHRKTKGNGSAKASLTLVFKLAQIAAKGWRKPRGNHEIPDVLRGVQDTTEFWSRNGSGILKVAQ